MSTRDVYRRDAVSFDPRYFEKQKILGNVFTIKEAFHQINNINLWGSPESASGEGSTIAETTHLKPSVEKILMALGVRKIVDAGCGDFRWLRTVDLSGIQYHGFDVLEKIILEHRIVFAGNENLQFTVADISQTVLPQADLILCRDCLVHFSFDYIKKTLINFKRSGSKYLLTTTFTETSLNEDIVTGDWRTFNLELKPFNFPKPLHVITEGCAQNEGLYKDKSLALWELKDIDIK